MDPDPDPLFFLRIRIQRGVKVKEDNLYKQIFNQIFPNDIKTPLKFRKRNELQKDPYFYVSSIVFT